MTRPSHGDAASEMLAERLRQMRMQADLAGKDLAAANQWAPSKVSRIENGHQRPSAPDVIAWVRTCGLDADAADELLSMLDEAERNERRWQRRMRRGQAAVQRDYTDLVGRSHLIRHFETVYVPGLLQTPDYARRVLAEMVDLHNIPGADLNDAVAARMQRQAMLYDTGRQFEFLLAEPVLRWLLCPAAVMRAQLDRLQTVLGLPNVRFGVLPLGAVLTTTPQNSFQIYDDLVCVETFLGETRHTGEEAAVYLSVMQRLWANAVVDDEARALIVRAAIDLHDA